MSDHDAIVSDPGGFVIDLSKPPYEVPCPTCLAWALEACRTEQKVHRLIEEPSLLSPDFFKPISSWPDSARVLSEAHEARQKHWEMHPEFRVKAIG